MEDIYSFWLDGPLQDVNLLSIRSAKAHGHNMILYAYDMNITTECEVRDGNEIIPKEEMYFYKHFPESFRLGGFAERFKANMLYKLGGWHIDLDVTLLQPLDIQGDYVFRKHPQGIVGNVIKAPAASDFAKFYVDWTGKITDENRDWEKSFKGLIGYLEKHPELKQYIQPEEILGQDLPNFWWDFLKTDRIPPKTLKVIHWCKACNESYVSESFYNSLLKQYNII